MKNIENDLCGTMQRDTFLTNVLAAPYLHDELGASEDEEAAACSVDNTYYEAVKTLQKIEEEGNDNLQLMGIEPTYPSYKYGYTSSRSLVILQAKLRYLKRS